jgi:hypothetical protein
LPWRCQQSRLGANNFCSARPCSPPWPNPWAQSSGWPRWVSRLRCTLTF